MIEVKESRDEAQILSFIKGPGVQRRISEGSDTPLTPEQAVKMEGNHFIVAYDNQTPVGFVAFMEMAPDTFGVHVVLRTMGIKTLKIIEMAIDWAFKDLKAKTLFAIYPEGHIAVRLLAAALGFTEDKETAKSFQFPGNNTPLMFQRLDSNLT